jgi:hypothetical protein
VTDDLPLSPELVLVAPLELARQARAALPDPPALPARPAGAAAGRGEIAAAYAVSLAVTLVPLALTFLIVPTR